MNRKMRLSVLAILSFGVLAISLNAADWPQWRGPEGTGVSSEKQPPIVWHEQRSIV